MNLYPQNKQRYFLNPNPDYFRCHSPDSIRQRMVKSPLETLTLKTLWTGRTSDVLLVKFPWIPWNTHKKSHWGIRAQQSRIMGRLRHTA